MSNKLNLLKRIDEVITDGLTKLCWWADITFDKDNVWFAKMTLAIVSPILWVIQSYFYNNVRDITEIVFVFSGSFLISWVLFNLIFLHFSVTKRIIQNAQKSPNWNRNDIGVICYKAAILMSTLCLWVFPKMYPFMVSEGFEFAAFFSMELILYFLCTEPIPPAVKRKKLEELENKRLQFVPQKN